MPVYYLYVLRSSVSSRHYIGITIDPAKRLKQHNQRRVRSTKAYAPWKLIHSEAYSTKSEARRREIELKRSSKKRQELFEKISGPVV